MSSCGINFAVRFSAVNHRKGIMESTAERRHDDQLRAVIEQAIEFKSTIGQSVAMSFLVEHYVPLPLLQRVLMRTGKLSHEIST